MMYRPIDVSRMLDRFTILADTREHDTKDFVRRMDGTKHPWRREKLEFGDYSAEVTDDAGNLITLKHCIAIERKMSLDELAMCFGIQRERFEREFERAAQMGGRIWLLVENATWERLYTGDYRSSIRPASLAASVISWSRRYNMVPVFCCRTSTSKLIADILRYELKGYFDGQHIDSPSQKRLS